MAQLLIMGMQGQAMAWAARALVLGHDVAILKTPKRPLDKELAAARHAMGVLIDVALPKEGWLSWPDTAPTADWVIDATTERLQIGGKPLHAAHPVWLSPVIDQAPEGFCAAMGVGAGDVAMANALFAACGGDIDAAVAALRALKSRALGIGAILAEFEVQIAPRAPTLDPTPLRTLARQVPPDWVDYNGHMNEARYLTAFSDATDRLLLWAGMDAACIAEGHSVFTVETHIRHLGEVDIRDRIEVRSQVLEAAGKRLHLWHELIRGGDCAATGEQLLLHVDLRIRRPALPRADVGEWLAKVAQSHADLPAPDGLGRWVGAPR